MTSGARARGMRHGGEPAAPDLFRRRFGREPTLLVRAPGRVNLIGEHVDYVGLAVLPVALDRAVTLHLAPREDDVVRVVNADPSFGERRFRLDPDPDPGPPGDWVNYLLAAVHDRVRAHGAGALRGFDAVLASDVPVAAGLSSSAALVVAAALAVEAAAFGAAGSDRAGKDATPATASTGFAGGPGSGVPTPPLELAEALARAERFVGTQGGGMDQAVSLCAREGHAALIRFEPLRVEHVAVPTGWRFVVANSLAKAEKSGAAREAYNDRTRACAEALTAVRARLGRDDPGEEDDSGEDDPGEEAPGYPELLDSHDPDALLDLGRDALGGTLLRRFRHVVTEGARVAAARDALERDDLAGFGALMDAGHASLRDDYDVSTPALDRLVELAREGGAEGARLTGAGFGGCIVALCHEAAAGAMMEHLEGRYYGALRDPGPRRDRLFAVEPGRGADVTRA